MIRIDLEGAGAIVTGGTSGLGLATGLALARAGATVFLTYHWGSAEEQEILDLFAAAGVSAPHLIEADVSDADATRALMHRVAEQTDRLHVVVSNVAFAKVVSGIDDLKRSSLELSLGYSAWPVVDLVQSAREVMGQWPRYVIGISSDGPDVCHPGYDLAGASKAVLETLCRYLAVRLRDEGVRVNALRPGFLDTPSSRATFGDVVVDSAIARGDGVFLDPARVAGTVVALCSGLMDSVNGQVINVDEGWSLVSPLSRILDRAEP